MNAFKNIKTALENKSEVTHLLLKLRKGQSLPEEILCFPHLKTLEIHSEHETALPAFIGEKRGLQSLTINFKNLEHLPPAVFLISSLKILKIKNSKMETLPDINTNRSN